MMLWLVLALLVVATVTALLYPLLRQPATQPARADFDLSVYRSQLAEIDQDIERGLLSPEQAEAARTEIQRRMLAVAEEPSSKPTDHRRARRAAAVVIAVILPVGSGLLYAALGSPQVPAQPYAERLQHDPAVIIASAADHLRAQIQDHPTAPGYLRLADLYVYGRDYTHAAAAFQRAIALGANDANTWSKLGETVVLETNGAVAPAALIAFAHALEVNPQEPRARYYAGFAEAQIGRLKPAVAIWRDLENDSKPDAPWLALLRTDIATYAKRGGFDPATVPPSPPDVASMKKAVAAMQAAMQAQQGAMGGN